MAILGPEWPVDGSYVPDQADYVTSLVIESPDMFCMMPNKKMMYVYVMGRGIIRVVGNFRHMSDLEVQESLVRIRNRLG